MLQTKLKQGLGNWVDGEKFFDREKEMDLFRGYLRDGVSLLLVAPRRIGKTSFMREAGRLSSSEVIALHVDLQKANTPEEAIVELGLACHPFASLWQKAAGAFGDLLAKLEVIQVSEISVTLRSTLSASNWRQKGDELIAVLAAASKQEKKPVVIFLDEVPILVNRILAGPPAELANRRLTADSFMSWMRENTLRHKGHVVFVVTGSIGLEPVLRTAGLSATLNAFHPFQLLPWKTDIAKACLLALAREKSFQLTDAAAERMIRNLGCAIPHHVQLYFDQVSSAYLLDDKSGETTIEFVDEVYSKGMTGLRGHADLMHMEERLRSVLNDALFHLAITLLTEGAVVGRLKPDASKAICKQLSASREEMLETLGILEHDGYLEKSGSDMVFVSHLVRDWWRNRFGYGYTPAG